MNILLIIKFLSHCAVLSKAKPDTPSTILSSQETGCLMVSMYYWQLTNDQKPSPKNTWWLTRRTKKHAPTILKVLKSSSSQFSNSALSEQQCISSNDKNPIIFYYYFYIYFFPLHLIPDTRVCNGGVTLYFESGKTLLLRLKKMPKACSTKSIAVMSFKPFKQDLTKIWKSYLGDHT